MFPEIAAGLGRLCVTRVYRLARRRATGLLRCILTLAWLVAVPLPAYSQDAAAGAGEEKTGEVVVGVTAAQLKQAIAGARGYINRYCYENGAFRYLAHLDREINTKKYNLLRHSGTVYALGQAYARDPDEETLRSMSRAVKFLRGFVSPADSGPDCAAVWSKPLELGKNPAKSQVEAKLGGTALGVIALLSLEKAAPGAVRREEVRGLGNFLLSQQRADGSFTCKYYLDSGKADEWESLYYPGEAMLALCLIDDYDPDDKWARGAARCMSYLADDRKEQHDPPADHWALLATGPLLKKLEKMKDPPITPEAALRHAEQIVNVMLGEQVIEPEVPAVHGSYGPGARVCPAAIRVEGMVAAHAFFPEDRRELKEKIRKSTTLGLAFVLRAQVPSGPYKGGFIRSTIVSNAPDAEDDNRRAAEIRIDYVQHSLSALIAYERAILPYYTKKPEGDAGAEK